MLKSEKREGNKIYCEYSSSDILSSVYETDKDTLTITFKKGNVYKYHPISASKHDGLKNALSQGKYFSDHFQKSKDKITVTVVKKATK